MTENQLNIIIGDFILKELNYTSFIEILNAIVIKFNPLMIYTYISEKHPYYKYYIRSCFLPNPLNYNLNFGTRKINEKFKLNTNNWGLSFLDIDTF